MSSGSAGASERHDVRPARALVRRHHRLETLGQADVRRDRVHADAVGRELERERAGDADRARLGGGVGGVQRRGAHALDGHDVDHAAAACCARPGAVPTSCVQCSTDSRFARQSACQPLGALSRNGAAKVPPALFTRTSTGPKRAAATSSAPATASGSLASAGSATASPPARVISSAVRLRRLRVQLERADARAEPRQGQRDAAADPGARAGDQGGATGQDRRCAGPSRVDRRSTRRVHDEHALAAPEAVAEAVGVRRPALRVLLRVGAPSASPRPSGPSPARPWHRRRDPAAIRPRCVPACALP